MRRLTTGGESAIESVDCLIRLAVEISYYRPADRWSRKSFSFSRTFVETLAQCYQRVGGPN